MLLLNLLRARALDASRGDVAVFNNTSAEHPATYDFVRRLADECEEQHGIPFFWIEFQTYEGASQGRWRRFPTFRLVNKDPYHKRKNPYGYRSDGSVFEEMISHHNFLPSRQTRSCTKEMKVNVTSAFIAEWLACKRATVSLGHNRGKSRITKEEIRWQYLDRNGSEGVDEYVKRKDAIVKAPFLRPSQAFNDYSKVGVRPLEACQEMTELNESIAPLKGDDAVEYIAVIGIRNDEPNRVARIKERGQADVSAESVYMPLADAGVSKQDVQDFWSKQKYNLALPDDLNLSNCVYCFMKGANALTEISRRMAEIDKQLPPKLRSVKGTPSDIAWWIKMERKYMRTKEGFSAKTKGTKIKVGFFGVNSPVGYRTFRIEAKKKGKTSDNGAVAAAFDMLPCDCTD